MACVTYEGSLPVHSRRHTEPGGGDGVGALVSLGSAPSPAQPYWFRVVGSVMMSQTSTRASPVPPCSTEMYGQRQAAGERSGGGEERNADRRLVSVNEDQRLRAIVEEVGRVAEVVLVILRRQPVAHIQEVLENWGGGIRDVVRDDASRPLQTGEDQAGTVRHDPRRDTLGLGSLGVGAVVESGRRLVRVERALSTVHRRRTGPAVGAEVGIGDGDVSAARHKLHVGARVPNQLNATIARRVPREDGDGAATHRVGSTRRRRRRAAWTHGLVLVDREVRLNLRCRAGLAAAGVLREVARREDGREQPAELRVVAAADAVRVRVAETNLLPFDFGADANHVLSVAGVSLVGGNEVVDATRREGRRLVGHEHFQGIHVVCSPRVSDGDGVVPIARVHGGSEERETLHQQVLTGLDIPNGVRVVVLQDDEEIQTVFREGRALRLRVKRHVLGRRAIQTHTAGAERLGVVEGPGSEVLGREGAR
eukprot:scaffold4206_cov229-Pinguiococcus_pyrenoidosus.AAC.3